MYVSVKNTHFQTKKNAPARNTHGPNSGFLLAGERSRDLSPIEDFPGECPTDDTCHTLPVKILKEWAPDGLDPLSPVGHSPGKSSMGERSRDLSPWEPLTRLKLHPGLAWGPPGKTLGCCQLLGTGVPKKLKNLKMETVGNHSKKCSWSVLGPEFTKSAENCSIRSEIA